jgi:hypothetical protein
MKFTHTAYAPPRCQGWACARCDHNSALALLVTACFTHCFDKAKNVAKILKFFSNEIAMGNSMCSNFLKIKHPLNLDAFRNQSISCDGGQSLAILHFIVAD